MEIATVDTAAILEIAAAKDWKRVDLRDKKLISFTKGGTRIDIAPKTMSVSILKNVVGKPKETTNHQSVTESELLAIFTQLNTDFKEEEAERHRRVSKYLEGK